MSNLGLTKLNSEISNLKSEINASFPIASLLLPYYFPITSLLIPNNFGCF